MYFVFHVNKSLSTIIDLFLKHTSCLYVSFHGNTSLLDMHTSFFFLYVGSHVNRSLSRVIDLFLMYTSLFMGIRLLNIHRYLLYMTFHANTSLSLVIDLFLMLTSFFNSHYIYIYVPFHSQRSLLMHRSLLCASFISLTKTSYILIFCTSLFMGIHFYGYAHIFLVKKNRSLSTKNAPPLSVSFQNLSDVSFRSHEPLSKYNTTSRIRKRHF